MRSVKYSTTTYNSISQDGSLETWSNHTHRGMCMDTDNFRYFC